MPNSEWENLHLIQFTHILGYNRTYLAACHTWLWICGIAMLIMALNSLEMFSFWYRKDFGPILYSAEEMRHNWTSDPILKNGCILFIWIHGNAVLIMAQPCQQMFTFWYRQDFRPIFHSAKDMRHVWTSD